MLKLYKTQKLDLSCAGASLAFAAAPLVCAVHCALLPVFFASMPALGISFFTSEAFEWILIIFSLFLASFSIFFGMRLHGSRKALSVLLVGALLLLLARLTHGTHSVLEHSTAQIFTVKNFSQYQDFFHSFGSGLLAASGGLLIVVAHLINLKLCRNCSSHRDQNYKTSCKKYLTTSSI